MKETDRDNVIQLRQYGKGGWQESRGKIYKAIMAGEEFQSGKLYAAKYWDLYDWDKHDQTGVLPDEWVTVLQQDAPDYVLWSYRTPIAWHVPDDGDNGDEERWVVPNVKYSMTTTRHQNLVRTALVFNKTEPIEELEDA